MSRLPDAVTKVIAEAWKAQIKDASGKPVWLAAH